VPFSNEGIVLGDPDLISHRSKTCTKILQLLFQNHIVLVKGPPFSGKTSLAQLIYKLVYQDPKITIYFCTLASADNTFNFESFWEEKVCFFFLIELSEFRLKFHGNL
jgi:predicted AAA+ superfamily ATPase